MSVNGMLSTQFFFQNVLPSSKLGIFDCVFVFFHLNVLTRRKYKTETAMSLDG